MSNENEKPAPTRGSVLQLMFEKMAQYSILSKLIATRAPLKATSKETGIESRADFVDAARERDRIGESAADAFDTLVSQAIVKFFAKPSRARDAVTRILRVELRLLDRPLRDDQSPAPLTAPDSGAPPPPANLVPRIVAREHLSAPVTSALDDFKRENCAEALEHWRGVIETPTRPQPVARVELVGRSEDASDDLPSWGSGQRANLFDMCTCAPIEHEGMKHEAWCPLGKKLRLEQPTLEGPSPLREAAREYFRKPARHRPSCSDPSCTGSCTNAPIAVTDPDRGRSENASDDLPSWGAGPRDEECDCDLVNGTHRDTCPNRR